ncbi:TatD family hydrolase [Parvularcula marina]|uniref:TatD family hydrolase n=1 Tax=Parvularcula marina TaxID=2292771 RepID=UPI003513169B
MMVYEGRMLVDSHVNLHGERYTDDLEEVIARARDAGIGAMLAISDRLDSGPEIKEVIAGRSNMWRSVGVHPHHAKDYTDLAAETLIAEAADPQVVGIGECGLDYHYEYSDRELQGPVFDAHVKAAQETGLPLIIHTREADDDMAAALEAAHAEKAFTPLLHCYTGGPDLASRGLALGAYVSFSGILTFKKAEEVREIARIVPMDRLLIETDCPFLAPVPHRGRRNEPAYLTHVAEALAELRGVSVDEIAEVTTDNFFRLFAKAARPA